MKPAKTTSELRAQLAALQVDDAVRKMFEAMLDEHDETMHEIGEIKKKYVHYHLAPCGWFPCVCGGCK